LAETTAMPQLLYSSEKFGLGATIELDSKEVVVCSIAQISVLVHLQNPGILGALLSSMWGARLYREKDVYKNAQTAMALSVLYPKIAQPLRHLKNPPLRTYANSIWHCASAAEVCTVFNQAASKVPDLENAAREVHLQQIVEDAKNWPPKRPPEQTAATYQVVYSDGVTQERELWPIEVAQWAVDSNKLEKDKTYRIVRIIDAQGRVVWSK
jgi:hypothetical protein